MTDKQLLLAAERVLDAFHDRVSMTTAEVRALLDSDEVLLGRCLAFLHDRDHVVASGEATLIHRVNLLDRVLSRVRSLGPVSPDEIAATLGVPVPLTCEALGWLEREGRVESLSTDVDAVLFRVT